MSAVLKVFKINILALIALPLLLLSIAVKLVLKALEKALVFVGVGAAILGLGILSLIVKNPGGLLEGVGTMLAILILFGGIIIIIVMVVLLFGTIAAQLFAVIMTIINGIFNFIYDKSHDGYCALFDICKSDYDELHNGTGGKGLRWFCVIWNLLRLFNFIIIKLFTFSLYISIAASVGLVAYCAYYFHNIIMKTFGISIFAYLKLYPPIESVFTVLYFAVLLLGTATVIISLGIEWREWGLLLEISTGDYQGFGDIQPIEMDSAIPSAFEDGKNAQRCQQYMDILSEMSNEFDELKQQLEIAMSIKHDSALSYKFSEYVSLMNMISKQMSSFKSEIDFDTFERQFIPLIEKAHRLSKDITKDTLKIINKNVHSSSDGAGRTMDFFQGCSTGEDLKRRYKALCKAYHPDVGGHEETFKILQNQYEDKIRTVK
jgi:hypothetical protein